MKKIYSFLYFLALVLALFSLQALRPKFALADNTCGGLVPPAPTKLRAVSGPKAGQVTLYWEPSIYATKYSVAYGTSSDKYMYGADNIGGENARSYTVGYLNPNTAYYFRISASRECTSPFSDEVHAVSAGGQQGVVTAAPKASEKIVTAVPTVQQTRTLSTGPVSKEELWAKSGPKPGEVTLYWKNVGSADNYHLVYGTEKGKYKYGALNIGKLTWFTVRKLNPGTVYYFALVPVSNGTALYTTNEVSSQAMVSVQVVQTTPDALIQPQPQASPTQTLTTPSTLELTPTSVPATSSGDVEPTTPAGY